MKNELKYLAIKNLAKISFFSTLIVFILFAYTANAYSGTYFNATLSDSTLTVTVQEPYQTACDNVGNYVPIYFDANDNDAPYFPIEQCGGVYDIGLYTSNTDSVRVVMVYDPDATFWYSGANLSYNEFLSSFPSGASFVDDQIITENTNSTWGSSNGFWGDTTPSVIASDLTASVQDTGLNLWPLFAFLGVGLAFAIAGLLITNIREKSVPELKNKDGEDFIYHSNEDLEFRRNYGSNALESTTKRKRGRPRKNPL